MSIDTEDEKKENDNGGNSTSYVSKVLNNAHYNFVKDNKNFAEIVNMSLGFKLVDPETLVDCDSREIALVLDGDETDEEKELIVAHMPSAPPECPGCRLARSGIPLFPFHACPVCLWL